MFRGVPYFEAQIDAGSGYTSIVGRDLGFNVTLGMWLDRPSASVTFDAWPTDVDEGVPIVLSAGWNGVLKTVFNGEIAGVDASEAAKTVAVQCQDAMAKLSKSWGNGFYEYISQDDAAVVQNLVEKSGIDPSLTSIQSSSWTIDYLPLRDGSPDLSGAGAADVPLRLIRAIDEARLYATYTRSNGAVYRRPIALNPSPEHTYASGGSGVRDIQMRRSKDGIINKVLVKGLTVGRGIGIEKSASASNSYLPAPFEYNAETISNNLIISDTIAQNLADGRVALYNRRPQTVTVIIDGDGDVQPGETMAVTSAFCQLADARCLITGVNHRASGVDFVTTITGLVLA